MNLSILKEEIKKRVPFKEQEFDVFARSLSVVMLRKKEVWEERGKVSQNMGFVNFGMLRRFYLKEGDEFTDGFYAEGEFIGNYISYLSQEPSNTVTVALEACELLIMPFSQLESLYKVIPVVEQFSKYIGEKKLFELNKRNASLLMDSPEERYYKLVSQRPGLHDRVPQYLIAQYLGVRPESLSRIRKRHIS